MWVENVIEDVASRLKWDNGDTISPKTQKKIVRGLRRVFDRFSIDGRKLPVVNEIELTVTRSENRLGVGVGEALETWAAPNTIYYAAWKHRAMCGCAPQDPCAEHASRVGYSLCEEPLRVITDENWHQVNPCRNILAGRPTELYYQNNNGEIVFNTRPFVGDKLLIRASMPFDVRLFDSCSPATQEYCYEDNQWEFEICPSHLFDYATRESILCEAREKFDGCPDWSMCTMAQPCDECACPVEVKVTVKPLVDLNQKPVKFDGDPLPAGYYDALVRILTYDLAPEASLKRTRDMKSDRDEAVKLLHRSNTRSEPFVRDLTTYWSGYRNCGDDYPEQWGTSPGGLCGC